MTASLSMMPQPSDSLSTLSELQSLLNKPPRSSQTSITTTSSFIYKGVLGTLLYVLCLMMLKALSVKLFMKYVSESSRTWSYILIHLLSLSQYLLQLRTLLPLHLRILLLAYVLCLFRQWLPCPCCRNQPQQMNRCTNFGDLREDVPLDPHVEHVLHVHPLLPLPTIPHVIANVLHP